MPQVHGIRDRSRDGHTVSEISRELKVDEKTVRKYLKQENFSPIPPHKIARPSALDPHKPLIDRWIGEDQQRWYKQRHTAKRIYERLIDESPGFSCSYNTVQRYVRAARRSLRVMRASQELVWHPGEAQADFGEAEFLEDGAAVRKKYLTLSFPHSNDSFSQVAPLPSAKVHTRVVSISISRPPLIRRPPIVPGGP